MKQIGTNKKNSVSDILTDRRRNLNSTDRINGAEADGSIKFKLNKPDPNFIDEIFKICKGGYGTEEPSA